MGRHRLSTGSVQPVANGLGGWMLVPTGRPTGYVGRVGTLAVALGIGGLLAGMPAVAAADAGDTGGATDASAADTSPGPRAGTRDRAADRPSVNPSSDSGSTPAAAHSDRNSMAAARRGHSTVTIPSVAGSSHGAVTAVAPQADSTPSIDLAPAVDAPALAAVAPQNSTSPALAAAVAPVMTVAMPQGAVSSLGSGLLGWLGGGGIPGTPAVAPLAWATLAVSRRGLSGAAAVVAPAAATSAVAEAVVTTTRSTIRTFLASPGVTAVLAGAVGQLATAVLDGASVSQALQTAWQTVKASPEIQAGLGAAANTALSTLLTNPDVLQLLGSTTSDLVTRLAGNPATRAVVAQQVTQWVTAALGDSPAAADVSTVVAGLLADPAAAGTAITTLLGQPGIVSALGGAAGQVTVAVLGGADLNQAMQAVSQSLQDNPAVQAALESAITGQPNTFVPVVISLVSDTGIPQLVITLGGGSVNEMIGNAIGIAAVNLLANPAVNSGLAQVAGTAVAAFLGQPGVDAALMSAYGQLADAAIAGTDLTAAWRGALADLRTDPAITDALAATANAAVDSVGTALIGSTGVQQAIGATVTDLVAAFAADPTMRTLLEQQLGSISPALVTLLANPAATGDVAAALGAAVTAALGQPGVATALTGVVQQVADAVLAGTDATDALQNALSSLQSDAAVMAALTAVIPQAVDALINSSGAREALAGVAQNFVTTLLQDSGVGGGLADVAGQMTNAAVTSLLANPVVADLISTAAADLAGGAATSEVVNQVLQAVVHDPALQVALGTAVGQAIGSLLGDNPIGAVVGLVAGGAATLLIGLASGLSLLFTGGTGPVLASAPAAAISSTSHFFDPVPLAGDIYVVGAVG